MLILRMLLILTLGWLLALVLSFKRSTFMDCQKENPHFNWKIHCRVTHIACLLPTTIDIYLTVQHQNTEIFLTSRGTHSKTMLHFCGWMLLTPGWIFCQQRMVRVCSVISWVNLAKSNYLSSAQTPRKSSSSVLLRSVVMHLCLPSRH